MATPYYAPDVYKSALRDHQTWLGYLQPDGLVVSPLALVEAQVILNTRMIETQQRFVPFTQSLALGQNSDNEETIGLADFAAFCCDFLEWDRSYIYGLDDERPLPESLIVPLPELNEQLQPTYAIEDPNASDESKRWLLLVKRIADGQSLDDLSHNDQTTWSASPSRRFERLLRETQVPIGLLCNGSQLRLIFAPHGENAGNLTFPIQAMTETAGRAILAALHELLSGYRLFAAAEEQRLPALLQKSRDYQANVSIQLAQQVLTALYELLRGLQTAHNHSKGELLRAVLAQNPDQVYHGLLTVLLRAVFLLFAEDRGLMPNTGLYQQHYSIKGLFERLRRDAEQYPDTMDLRYGAWQQLLTLFRAVYNGVQHPQMPMPARKGYLFDPARFPFLAGQTHPHATEPHTAPALIADGVVYRVLTQLMMLNGERLSYRSLDVEQIGSVYETMMGFHLRVVAAPSIAIKPPKPHGAPLPIALDTLLAHAPSEREKWLKTHTGQTLSDKAADALRSANNHEALLAALDKSIAWDASPSVLPSGAMMLWPSDERRNSGSHYTPRALTEPIVRKTLAPIFVRLGDNASPEQLLDLKICDPAMGSGAFLVEACRQLAERLLQAWQRHHTLPPIPPDEDDLLYARRLVAQRCLYGVDKNPMAVDLAKLSLWLATLAREHPFTFVDHSLRVGDSLLGLSRAQIERFDWRESNAQLFNQVINNCVSEALQYRALILDAGDSQAPEAKRKVLDKADALLNRVRLTGDVALGAFFAEKTERKRASRRETLIAPLASHLALPELPLVIEADPRPSLSATPFHWHIEYPEVFERNNAGFDAMVGNPPFVGGQKISGANGDAYLAWLNTAWGHTRGSADLCAYFFLRVFGLLRQGGGFGLIATNTIAQGDTRERGLDWLCANGCTLYDASNNLTWPGEAAVVVNVVHGAKGGYNGTCYLDGKAVRGISPYLEESNTSDIAQGNPKRLAANANHSFIGSYVLGMGFVLPPEHAQALIAKDPRNQEVLFPYLNGEDLNSRPDQSPSRWVINFFDWSEERARTYPDCFEIVERLVKPERTRLNEKGEYVLRKPLPEKWWIYGEKRPALYATIAPLRRVLAIALTSKTCAVAFMPNNIVFSHATGVFSFESYTNFAIMQSNLHVNWAFQLGSSMKGDLRYTPSDCFETFPFPPSLIPNPQSLHPTAPSLNDIGERYHEHRRQMMLARQEGLTQVYNRVHNRNEYSADVAQLRALQVEMDATVAAAYGWGWLNLGHGFHETAQGLRYTLHPAARSDVLQLLLALNFERAAQEQAAASAVAAAAPPAPKRRVSKSPSSSQQAALFG